jgi:ABC-type multidrug transport system fused ATPase/permease subunit
MGQMSGRATEAIAGVRVIKAFSAEALEAERFEKDSSEVYAARLRSVLPQSLFTAAVDACVLAGMNIPIQRVMVSAERIFEVMDMQPEHALDPSNGDGRALPHAGAAAIRFANVQFGYDAARSVLNDVTLDIAPGEIIALVGHSGGGKTSLVNLLLRFYEPTGGAILVDGVPVGQVPLAMLREQIGVVSQDTFLFSGTIGDNIAYGSPRATPEQIVAAARAAFAHDFIVRFPDGYETRVGERGATLSGGQRQRVAIARALLRDPRILIFDEATSNLDAESERFVQEAIRRSARGRTVLVIAHRLSTAVWADKIVVIEDGEIVEMGTHEALLRQKGLYSRLSTIQSHPQAARP